ncbi:MAG: cytochrome c-type biogenesis protein CcmH [Woeseiaceae bacterium]
MKTFLGCLMFLFLFSTALAVDSDEPLEDPELQARYENIVAQVRCLKCQNQTIKDSNAFLAGDLRREIRRMLLEGYTDDEIFDFLVQRYGDFALYSPRMSGKTLVVWIVPAVFLLGGAFVLFNIIRRRMALPIDNAED